MLVEGIREEKGPPRALSSQGARVGLTRGLIRGGLVLVALGLAWRIVSVGMAAWHADQDPSSNAPLAWYPRHPEALRRGAESLLDRDPARAETMLQEALRANPTEGHTLMDLARLWRHHGRRERAMRLAGRIGQAQARLHERAAGYWLERGDLGQAMKHWDLALRIRPENAGRLFPVLLRLAQDPAGEAALRASARESPAWWPPFLVYTANNAAQLDTLRILFALRHTSSTPLSIAERNACVDRLQRERQWSEAYVMWLNTLAPHELRVAGHLYDGGFELSAFARGFDWQLHPRPDVIVTTGRTYAIGGRKALHLVFRDRPLPGPIIEQALALTPGGYRLGGRVRPDRLQAGNGLRWVLSCAAGEHFTLLAATERFLGSDEWRDFNVDFTVPPVGCAGQRLYLQVAGGLTPVLRGASEIWFDDLSIAWRLVGSATSRRLPPSPGKVLASVASQKKPA